MAWLNLIDEIAEEFALAEERQEPTFRTEVHRVIVVAPLKPRAAKLPDEERRKRARIADAKFYNANKSKPEFKAKLRARQKKSRIGLWQKLTADPERHERICQQRRNARARETAEKKAHHAEVARAWWFSVRADLVKYAAYKARKKKARDLKVNKAGKQRHGGPTRT